MYPTIARQELGPGDLLWCASPADLERFGPEALGACPQDGAIEMTDGRRLRLDQMPEVFKRHAVRRVVLLSEPCPPWLLQSGCPIARLDARSCDQDDFISAEESEEVARRLRELGYI